jgi:hypothetical protein
MEDIKARIANIDRGKFDDTIDVYIMYETQGAIKEIRVSHSLQELLTQFEPEAFEDKVNTVMLDLLTAEQVFLGQIRDKTYLFTQYNKYPVRIEEVTEL